MSLLILHRQQIAPLEMENLCHVATSHWEHLQECLKIRMARISRRSPEWKVAKGHLVTL